MSRSLPPLPLWFAAAASLGAMLLAARTGLRWAVLIAAAAFAFSAAMAALQAVKAAANTPQRDAAKSRTRAFIDGTRITALVYAWGGLAMLTLYRFTPLQWQHGWQYGSAMLLIAAALVALTISMNREGSDLQSERALSRIIVLAALHGLAALGALTWLVISGKLATPKADWAANDIFTMGGLAVVAITYIAVRTDRALGAAART